MTGGQMIGAGNNANRVSATLPSEVPSLLQCLPLEPITLGNQKYIRSGELRKIFGIPLASAPEDHSFGTANPKPLPHVASEELKHFKDSLQDALRKARERAKLFHGSLYKLERYEETITSKKRQRNDLTVSERTNGANVPKPGNHVQRGLHGITSPRLEDKDKAAGTNKRARTVVSDIRADGRSNVAPNQQMVVETSDDLQQDFGGRSFRIEERILRLPAGGEGWESKIKRKRSVGAVGSRGINGDTELKRSMHPKMSSESKLRASDVQGLRSKASPSISSVSKLESSLDHTSSGTTSTTNRSESENTCPPVNKVALLEQKSGRTGGNKPNFPKDAISNRLSISTKPKVSRAPRTGSIMLLDSSLKVSLSSSSPQGSEQPADNDKVPNSIVANDHKCRASEASPSHSMAQWQRPHKNSRTRRSKVVAPVSNHDEAGISSPNLLTPELNTRALHFGTNGSPASNSVDITSPKFKKDLESSGSPFGLSEGEETGAEGSKATYKGRDNGDFAHSPTQKVGAHSSLIRKNKFPATQISDGVRKGRNGKASLVGRPAIFPVKEKKVNTPNSKPVQHLKSGSDKNRSKTGRPPARKLKDRKPSSRVGPVPNSVSPDFIGELDDDREELIAAAKAARNAKDCACTGPFWKKMESIFSAVGSEDISYLKQQLGLVGELEDSFSQMLDIECSIVVDGSSEESDKTSLFGRIEVGGLDKGCSLYQRVLSAIIDEDDGEELFIHSEGRNMSASDDSHCGSCNLIDIDPRDKDRVESEAESKVNFQPQKNGFVDRNSSDKSVSSNSIKDSSLSSSLSSNGYWFGDNDPSHSDIWHTGEICSNDSSQLRDPNAYSFCVTDQQYHLLSLDDRLMLELQSIGLCPESLPDLTEEDNINQEIIELKGGLRQQIGRKKRKLEKLNKALHLSVDVEKRKIEQVAMDQLIEIAYRRRLACRGNHYSKTSVSKESRQAALAFIKRTLARCRKLEDTGSSCFNEPALHELIFSTPCNNDAKSADCVGSGTASNTHHELVEARSGAGVSPSNRYNGRGSSHDRSKTKEVLIDEVIGSASSRAMSTPECSTPGEVRGKRSDKDRDQNKVNSRSVSVLGDFRNESKTKTKTKPKQRVNHLSSPDARPLGPINAAANPNNKADQDASLQDMFNEAGAAGLAIPDLDSFGLESNEQQDLDFFSNIDDDGHDIMGLEIPMDDLGDLNLVF